MVKGSVSDKQERGEMGEGEIKGVRKVVEEIENEMGPAIM